MIGPTSGLPKAMYATAAITTQFVIAKFGADDDTIAVAAASSDGLIGIVQDTITTANITAGNTVIVEMGGISYLKLGDTVARGALITSDASGYGVTCSSGRYVGIAMASGVVNDVIPVKVSLGSI